MKEFYTETISTCTKCGEDVKGVFWKTESGIQLDIMCEVHGIESEIVEKNTAMFCMAYEHQGYKPLKYLILPVTYRCNLGCRYCYAHSNYKHSLPPDRSIESIISLINDSGCSTVNLAGGEPTVREDLPAIIRTIKKETLVKRVCVVTNGQKTKNEKYLNVLRESGMDFLFLPLYIPGYDPYGKVINNIKLSLENANSQNVPVWIQATIENTDQINYVMTILEQYQRIIFNITIRSVRPYGLTEPKEMVFVSDILQCLGKEKEYVFGNHSFNRFVKLFGRNTKVSSWVNDRIKLDPYDALYLIHDDRIVPFHKGMILDNIYFKASRVNC
jgi:MoaA/NifB/PqqE/SkfB family radical SAM enzyme